MKEFGTFLLENIKTFNLFTDLLDILLVTYVIYLAITFLRQTRAVTLIKGVIFLFALTLLANLLKMNVTSYIIKSTLDFGVLALLIIFQPELRSLLDRMGRGGKLNKLSIFTSEDETMKAAMNVTIDAVVSSTMKMSKTKTGALIVMEGSTRLGDIIKSGTVIDAAVSEELIINVFYPKSPLHDGALIMRQNRLVAAGCVLPLTSNVNLSSQLGTRHRAAIGMSEAADCLVIVVSEETGTISTAINGTLTRGLNAQTLSDTIHQHVLLPGEGAAKEKIPFFLRRRDK